MDFNADLGRVLKYGVGHSHADFVRKIAEEPTEHTPALVYADWLEENGHSGVADHIRKVVQDDQKWAEQLGKPTGVGVFRHDPDLSWRSIYARPEGMEEGSPSVHLSTPYIKDDGKQYVTLSTLHYLNGLKGDRIPEDHTGGLVNFRRTYEASDAMKALKAMGNTPHAKTAMKTLRNQIPDYLRNAKKSESSN